MENITQQYTVTTRNNIGTNTLVSEHITTKFYENAAFIGPFKTNPKRKEKQHVGFLLSPCSRGLM